MPVQALVHGLLRSSVAGAAQRLAERIADDLDARQRPAMPYLLHGVPGTANADLLRNRLWLDATEPEVAVLLREAHLRTVAEVCGNVPADLVDGVHARRRRAALLQAQRTGAACVAVEITPMGRMVVGHGADSVHESGLALSPTYGLPVLPGTALKGIAAASARAGDPAVDDTVFGLPRPGTPPDETAHVGTVRIGDALPTAPPKVAVDVLTPHAAPYYRGGNTTGVPTADAAEYHNPVPVRFLAVEPSTRFRTYAVGPRQDLAPFLRALLRGLDERGLGGKTAAGYGYATAEPRMVTA